MSAIDELFEQLGTSQTTAAFMPFVTAGDPDLSFTAELMETLDSAGCHLVELGFPYSDPIADGPIIQDSYARALQNNIKVEQIFSMVKQVSPRISMPVVAMVSYALIYRYGPKSFVKQAKQSGISGAIVPDLPVDESDEFLTLCNANHFNLVQLITPTTTNNRAIEIAESSTGFIYYVSIAGITGERTKLPVELTDRLIWLKQHTDTPVCVGFGISKPEQAQMLASHADGVIVGSAIVKLIAGAVDANRRQETKEMISTFAKSMVCAVTQSSIS